MSEHNCTGTLVPFDDSVAQVRVVTVGGVDLELAS